MRRTVRRWFISEKKCSLSSTSGAAPWFCELSMKAGNVRPSTTDMVANLVISHVAASWSRADSQDGHGRTTQYDVGLHDGHIGRLDARGADK